MIPIATPYQDPSGKLLPGHWLDSIGNSIIVSRSSNDRHELISVVTPLADHPDARDRVLAIRLGANRQWRCGNANLAWYEEQQRRLIWVADDGRRCVWTRTSVAKYEEMLNNGAAFPWMLNTISPEAWMPLSMPRDILYDAARIACLLDVRQIIGVNNEAQEHLTRIIMDYDLLPGRGDYLIPGHDSPAWDDLEVSDAARKCIKERVQRVVHESLSQRIAWNGNNEIWVGHHKIAVRDRDISRLQSRWVLAPNDERMPLEIARLLALYSVFDNPQSSTRNGVHLGLEPLLRTQCDYELFASPLNAEVPNGCFASKWPHVEWRFGSMGSYPSVLNSLPDNSIVCVNPPFTDAYLADVMERVDEFKTRFRLRIAIPVKDSPWRAKLAAALPGAQVLRAYFDASDQKHIDVLHPTLLWEDPCCPKEHSYNNDRAHQEELQDGVYYPPPTTAEMAISPMLLPSFDWGWNIAVHG